MWSKSGSVEKVVQSIETMVSTTNEAVPSSDGTTFFSCTCTSGTCTAARSSVTLPWNFGFAGEPFNVHESIGRDPVLTEQAIIRRLNELVQARKDAMKAWSCKAQDVGARADAITTLKNCLMRGSQTTANDLGCNFEEGFCGWTTQSLAWTRNSGGTPSSGTGPARAHEGSWYVFTEVSSPNHPRKSFYLESPQFTRHSLPFPISFHYHMYGISINNLQLEALVADTWTKVWDKVGSQGNFWSSAAMQVPAGASQVRFVGVSGTSYEGDIAIDDIEVLLPVSESTPPTVEKCWEMNRVACPDSTCHQLLAEC
jgi:hypothetical protein